MTFFWHLKQVETIRIVGFFNDNRMANINLLWHRKRAERSIRSVLMLRNIDEVIIGIDGSDDTSNELCNELQKKDT